MRTILNLLFLTIASLSFANNPIKEVKTVDIAKSQVKWTGKKVLGAHEGTISIKSGDLQFEESRLVGGTITIDMNTISCTDLEGDTANKLVGHLNSDDFFGVSEHPTASLSIIKASLIKGTQYNVDANITIKGITQAIQFEADVDEHSASTVLNIDRTKHNIKYGSGSFFDSLGDKAINDEFELYVTLHF